MSIHFSDSTDGYSAREDIRTRWSAAFIPSNTNFSQIALGVGAGRFGGDCIRFESRSFNANSCLLMQYLPLAEEATTYMSMALHLSGTYSADDMLFGFGNGYYNVVEDSGTTSGTSFNAAVYPTYINIMLTPTGQLRVRRGTTVLATSAGVLPIGTWMWLEIAVKMDAAGLVHIRVNGEDFLVFEGNTYVTGAKSVCAVGLWRPRTVLVRVDDAILHDDLGEAPTGFIGDVRIALLKPNADGDSSDSTPSAGTRWEAVNDATQDGDATYVQASTPGAKDLYQFENFTVPPESIVAVAVTLTAKATGTANRQVRVKAKASGVEADSPSLTLTPGTYRDVQFALANNPATGQPWTAAELDAAQFGWEVVT